MKFTGEKLRAVLLLQRESVTLVTADGAKKRGISARYVALAVGCEGFTGYGSFEVVSKVVSNDRPRRGPFATRLAIAETMAQFPRASRAQKNAQYPGAAAWVIQPTRARSGHVGNVSTVHFG